MSGFLAFIVMPPLGVFLKIVSAPEWGHLSWIFVIMLVFPAIFILYIESTGGYKQ